MRIDEIKARKAEIRELLKGDTSELNIDDLTEEVRTLDEETKQIEERAAAEAELRKAVAADVVAELTKNEEDEKRGNKMDNILEIRSSNEYAAAFLKAIKTGDESEARALLTVGASGGQIPVPTMLENEIKTAWEEHQLMQLVKHSYFKGNVKVGFELSATGASVHVEGADAPDEETVTIGVVEIKNESIKKWITVSDEALEGTTVETMGYLYKEIAHKITEKAEEVLIGKITAAPAAATATACGVPAHKATAIAADTILHAVALLSGEARNLNLVMNRQSYPAFMAIALAANYAVDVFDGLKDRIVFTDKLPAFSAASTGNTYAIVGDFGYGAQANFPNGDDVRIKVDDMSLAEKDLVKLVGRQYVGIGVVADKAFAKITK